MYSGAVIAGVGLVTPLGVDLDQTWQRLLNGWHIERHERVPLASGPGRPRVHQFAVRAALQAAGQAGWTDVLAGDPGTALLVGTSKGPADEWLADPSCPRANHSESWGLADVASGVAGDLGLGPGPRLTVCTACASGLHALGHAALLLAEGRVRRAIVVAVESSLHPLFLGSFERLGVLAREGHGCRPFGADRDGFLMSEAAAAVCLEAPPGASEAPAGFPHRWPRLERFSWGADAAHLTGGDRAGSMLQNLLRRVMDGRPVDLVHAHGTGTPINDPMELAAIEASVVAGDAPPSLYSHKGALGHSLGASGLVSVVLNCEAHRRGVVPPNVQTRTPLPAQRVRIDRAAVERPVRRSVAIAAGFGGAMAAATLCDAPGGGGG